MPSEVGRSFVAPVVVVGLFVDEGLAVRLIEKGIAGVALEFFEGGDESFELPVMLGIGGQVVPFLGIVFQVVERVFRRVFPVLVKGLDFGAERGAFVVRESGGHGDKVTGIEIARRDGIDVTLRG